MDQDKDSEITLDIQMTRPTDQETKDNITHTHQTTSNITQPHQTSDKITHSHHNIQYMTLYLALTQDKDE